MSRSVALQGHTPANNRPRCGAGPCEQADIPRVPANCTSLLAGMSRGTAADYGEMNNGRAPSLYGLINRYGLYNGVAPRVPQIFYGSNWVLRPAMFARQTC